MGKNEKLVLEAIQVLDQFPNRRVDHIYQHGLEQFIRRFGGPDQKGQNKVGSLVVERLNSIVEDYTSVSKRTKELFKEAKVKSPTPRGAAVLTTFNAGTPSKNNSDSPFLGALPSQTLPFPICPKESEIEMYSAWRAVLSLLHIGADFSPDIIFSNKKFLKAFQTEPWNKDSLFFKAVKIEPCILQTNFGMAALEKISLSTPQNALNLSKAIAPRGGKKTDKIDLSARHRRAVIGVSLLISVSPKFKKLSDTELMRALEKSSFNWTPLKKHKFTPLRAAIFRKK